MLTKRSGGLTTKDDTAIVAFDESAKKECVYFCLVLYDTSTIVCHQRQTV